MERTIIISQRRLIPFFLTLFLSALFFIPGGEVFAHQPVIVNQNTAVTVKDPEISKAYYGRLSGQPAVFTIDSKKPFTFYVNLLVPDVNDAKTDFSLEIRKNGAVIQELYGPDHPWLDFYEPFGDDYYLKGPEFESQAEPGLYTVKIHSPDNIGKYSLAIGKIENFGLLETLATLRALPSLKKDYFDRSPWTAYNNYAGLAVFIYFVLSGILVYFIIIFFKRRKKKAKLDAAYEKSRNGRVS